MGVCGTGPAEQEFRGTILPALAFEPRLASATEAVWDARALAVRERTLVAVMFLDGDRVVPRGAAMFGVAETAWPGGRRARTLPVRPALQIVDVRRTHQEAFHAQLAPWLRAEGCRRAFAYDTWLIGPGGNLHAVYWVVELVAQRSACEARHHRRR